MDCPNNSQLLDAVAGRLASDREAIVRAHLAECARCQQIFEDLRGGWDALGDWPVGLSAEGLARRVVAAAADVAQEPVGVGRQGRARVVLRWAASIALAAGLGVAAGELTPRSALQRAAPPSETDLETAREVLGLNELSVDSAAELADAAFVALPAQAEEAQP